MTDDPRSRLRLDRLRQAALLAAGAGLLACAAGWVLLLMDHRRRTQLPGPGPQPRFLVRGLVPELFRDTYDQRGNDAGKS